MTITTTSLAAPPAPRPVTSQRLTEGWRHYRGTLGGIWEVWRGDQLNNHYNVPWQTVRLPHCFNAQDAVDPDRPYYQGPGWYRSLLTVDNPYRNGRTLLTFDGAGQMTDVYVYTQHVHRHCGGYDEFTVDLTDAIDAATLPACYGGQVPLAICCDNARDLKSIPSDVADFVLYGGLYRPVSLAYVPAVSLARVHVDVEVDTVGLARVTVRSRLYNPDALTDTLELQIDVLDPDGAHVHRSTHTTSPWHAERVLTRCSLPSPRRWSPDDPALYRCVVTLNDGVNQTQVSERFGVRTFEFRPHGPFFLNGERLLLRGTHRHEDHAGVGAAMTEPMIRREMRLIKEMGCNFLRLGHYQQSRTVLDLCDELGLIVFEEIPWCRGGLGEPAQRQQCRAMLRSMIDQHRNHPSIIIWGLGNEIDWQADGEVLDRDEIRAFIGELHALAHELDPSRLTGLRHCEAGRGVVDVYSPSIWSGWYRGIYTEYEQTSRKAFEQLERFLHLEWGADSIAGRHAEQPYTGISVIRPGEGGEERQGDALLTGGAPRVAKNGDWSESYSCELIDWYLHAQARMDWLTGSAQWVFKDFATPIRPDNPLPYINTKGVVERDLTPKEAYFVFQSWWATQPMIHIHGHHAHRRWGRMDEEKLVKVYSNCPEVELFLNGEPCGKRQRNADIFPAAGLSWRLRFRPGENHLRAIAHTQGRTLIDELTFHYQIEPWGQPASLHLTAEPQDPEGHVRIDVTVHDERGVRCLEATFPVRFGITGDGRLKDNLGTVGGSRMLQLSNGAAWIRADSRGGRSVVSVTGGGLPAAFINL